MSPIGQTSSTKWCDDQFKMADGVTEVFEAVGNTGRRALHRDMDLVYAPGLALITIWKGKSGVAVEMSRDQETGNHLHDRFVFTSNESCVTRVWSDFDSTPEEYSLTKLRVSEVDEPDSHGGVHHPPWE